MVVVNEIFASIEGEGARMGELAAFVRVAGCPCRCAYCDTTYAREADAGTPMSVPEIVAYKQYFA